MFWILVAILSYFISGLGAVIDKYLLTGPIPHPKVYAFYTGALGILVLVFFPLSLPFSGSPQLLLALLAGVIFIFALFWFCKGLHLFEASRIVPAIGALNPLFVFFLNYLFFKEGFFNAWRLVSFLFLLSGSVVVTWKKGKVISWQSLKISAISAFLFSSAFVLIKGVYLEQTFWSGFVWLGIGGFLAALLFLFSKEVRKEISRRRINTGSKTLGLFLISRAAGGLSFGLQNWAISLVPLGLLSFINALEGTKYVFLLIFTVLLSLKFPKILKEETSKKILIQKIFAILLIAIGLWFLTR